MGFLGETFWESRNFKKSNNTFFIQINGSQYYKMPFQCHFTEFYTFNMSTIDTIREKKASSNFRYNRMAAILKKWPLKVNEAKSRGGPYPKLLRMHYSTCVPILVLL